FPIIFAVSTVAVLAVGIACSTERDGQPKSNTPATSPQLTTAVDSGKVVPPFVGQPVTFAAGEAAYTKRNYREAAEIFGSYVQEHPKNASGHYMLGLSAWKSGDLTGARTAFERSLALDSANVKTLLNLGRVLLEQGKADEAQVRIEAAVAL